MRELVPSEMEVSSQFRRIDAVPSTKSGQLTFERILLVVRAATWLTIASAAVARVPFRMAIRLGCIPLGRRSPASVERAVWAIEAAARRLPIRAMCIEKGIALQRLLRAAGFSAILHYGARLDPQTGELQAHVWVTIDDRIIIGGAEAVGFARIASYP